MTAFTAAESAIRSRLNANWATTPIAWENADPASTPDSGFVFCEILPAGADQVSIGSPTSRRFRHVGVIRLHIFVPVNKGTKLALEYADTLAAIFRGVEFSGVLCFAPGLSKGYGDDAKKWFRVTVSIPFQFDQLF